MNDICPKSGRFHSWRWDGDDPYIVCARCGEMRDAVTGRVIREGEEDGE